MVREVVAWLVFSMWAIARAEDMPCSMRTRTDVWCGATAMTLSKRFRRAIRKQANRRSVERCPDETADPAGAR